MSHSNDEQQRRVKECLQTWPVEWSDEAIAIGIREDFRCAYCRRDFVASLDDHYSWVVDHLHPKSDGGDDAIENKVASCRLCNLAKRDHVPQGATRAERIADAWRYTQANIVKMTARWEKALECVTASRTSQ